MPSLCIIESVSTQNILKYITIIYLAVECFVLV